SCSEGGETVAPERVDVSSEALNALPHIGDFVLYAERSVQLAGGDNVSFGDVGVRSAAPPGFGPQLSVGSATQAFRNLLAPSVSLATNAQVGDVQTNSLQNSGGSHGAVAAFPASAMPLLPVAPFSAPAGPNVTVAAGHTTTLNPGAYGAAS